MAATVFVDLGADLARVRQAVNDIMTSGPIARPAAIVEESKRAAEAPRDPLCPGCSALLTDAARLRAMTVRSDEDRTVRSDVGACRVLPALRDHVAHARATGSGLDGDRSDCGRRRRALRLCHRLALSADVLRLSAAAVARRRDPHALTGLRGDVRAVSRSPRRGRTSPVRTSPGTTAGGRRAGFACRASTTD